LFSNADVRAEMRLKIEIDHVGIYIPQL